jgi:indolepyruvate ferredoxin oxidoreductase
MEGLLGSLHASNHDVAVELARIPEQIKGFGHVKERNLAAARSRREALLAQWQASGQSQPQPMAQAA